MSAFVNIKNLHYAIMTTEDTPNAAPVYGEVKTGAVGKLIGAEVSAESNTATLYADGGVYEIANSMGDVNVNIETAELPLQVQADLLGHTFTDGVMVANKADVAPYVAIMFEFEKNNGKKRFVKLFKGKFTEPTESGRTKEEDVDFQTPSISGVFAPLKNDGNWKKVADEDEGGNGASWYSSVLDA